MSNPSNTIPFYFDYISPNAYLAWTQLPELARKHNVTIEPVPVLFAGLLQAHGQMGPAEQPAKREWMHRNIGRKAELLGIALAPPAYHPFNPLLVLRLSSADLTPAERWRLIDCFMRGIWAEGLHASDEQDVRRMISAADLPADALLQQAASADIRARLKQQTDDAIAQGVFGIPSLIHQDELFFGYDDLQYLEMVLSDTDPLPNSKQAQRWLNAEMLPSAQRKQVGGL